MRLDLCIYLWIRTDLPPADQVVQAAHVAQVAGARWGAPPGCHLVLLQSENQDALRKVQAFCSTYGVKTVAFEETDSAQGDDCAMGLTALSTPPLPPGAHRLFRRYELWKPRNTC